MNTQSPLTFLQTYLSRRYRKGILYLFIGPLCICAGLVPVILFPYGIHTDSGKVPDWVLVVFTAGFIGVGFGWFFTYGMMYIKAKKLLQIAETNPADIVWIYNKKTITTANYGLYSNEYKEVIFADCSGQKYKLPLGYKDDETFWNASAAIFSNAHIGATNYIKTLYKNNPGIFLSELKRQGLG
ncbi:hypothetical protein ACI6Q2_09700 [Chitinophagaceae bacterium LWZ2-11]